MLQDIRPTELITQHASLQVAAPLAYAAPAVTRVAAPAIGYTAAYGSYGLGYLHWSIA